MPDTKGGRQDGDETPESRRRGAEGADEDDAFSLMSASQFGIAIPPSDGGPAGPAKEAGADAQGERTLVELLRERGKLPPDEAIAIAKQIAGELLSTWDDEVVRVDIRPGNILVEGDGEVRIAPVEPGGRPHRPDHADDPIADDHNYVSPEELRGKTIDGRADIYALGVLLYRMVTGEFPFKGPDGDAIARARLEEPPKLANEVDPDVSPELAQIIDFMLADNLSFRYPNPSEFLRDVILITEGPPPDPDVDTTVTEKPESEADTPAAGTPLAAAAPSRAPTEGPMPSAQGLAASSGQRRGPDRAAFPAPAPTKGAAPVAQGLAAFPAPAPARKAKGTGREAPYSKQGRDAPPRSRATVAIVAAVTAGALAVLVAAILVLTLGPSRGTATGAGELEAEAEAAYQRLVATFDVGEYRRVVEEADSFGDRYVSTSRAADFDALRREAAGKMTEEAERLAAAQEAEAARRRELDALEADARAFHDARCNDYLAGNYESVLAEIGAAGGKYDATAWSDRIRSLGADAKKKLDEAELVALAEAKEKRYQELLGQAREEIGRGDHERALNTLERARAMKDSEEVAGLAGKAMRMRHIADAGAAEKGGWLARAIELYERALSLESDDELAEHVLALKRKARFKGLLAKAEARASARDWQAALDRYREALECAGEEDRDAVELAIKRVQAEIRYGEAIADARSALKGRRWCEAIDFAEKAHVIKPGDEEARRIMAAAAMNVEPDERIENSVGMDLVLVPAGEFIMGSIGGEADEGPVRTVSLDAYYIGVCEVTNAQFETFDPSRRDQRTAFSPADDTPVVLVTWQDATAFCDWLRDREGVEYRLPTEAEWEMAARGNDGRSYPWGNMPPGAGGTWRCNFAAGRSQESWGLDGHKYASPAGAYAQFASPHGMRDLSGNVWEWCLDWYRADYYSVGDAGNPTGPERGKQRVLRGGSFANAASAARSTNRTAKGPEYREASIGFRCVRALRRAQDAPVVSSSDGVRAARREYQAGQVKPDE
jgi:sulfatase modifying factor 1